MTQHHWRAPAGVRTLGRVLRSEETLRTAGLRNEPSGGVPRSGETHDGLESQPIAAAMNSQAVAGTRLNFEAGAAHRPELSGDLFGGEPAPAPTSPTFEARAAIWRDQANGLISIAEAQRRSAAIGAAPARKAQPAIGRAPTPRPRHTRPAPNASRQYAPPLATTAARDDRLTPQAKALLQVIRARCGKGTQTTTTKGTLAAVLSRSTRSIARYLRDLEAYGYVSTSIRRTGRGFHVGLVVTVLEAALPFWSETKALGRWLAETAGSFMPFSAETPSDQGMTVLSPKNQRPKESSSTEKNWPWRRVAKRPFAPS